MSEANTVLTAEMVNAQVQRAVIEAHLERCRNAAADNLLEIGRWLNEAKRACIVPRGQWADWVREHAGINERTAQRMMQMAREIPEGSPIARLGSAKITALLSLPPEEREDAAQAMDAENITSREVADKVAAIRRERDEALRLVGEQKKRIAEAAQRENNMRDVLDRNVRKLQDTREKLERERQEHTKHESMLQKKLGDVREQVDGLQQAMMKSESERVALSDQLQQARAGGGVSPEAEAEIDRLKVLVGEMNAKHEASEAELRRLSDLNERLENVIAKKEEEIDQLTDAVDAARTAALRAGGSEEHRSPTTVILSAIGALMAEAGRAPGELSRMQGIDEETAQLLRGQAQLVGQWAMSILAACGGDGL